MLSTKIIQLVARARESAPVYSSSEDSGSNRADVTSDSPPRPHIESQQRASPESYQRAKRGAFFQPMPQLHNPFIEDPFLRACLSNMLPTEVSEEVFSDLEQFGQRLCEEIDDLGRQAELKPPYLRPFDAWGNRVDDLVTSPAWKRQHDIAAEEGLVALAYERKHRQWSRLHQMAKLYLYAPSSGLYSCPLAMTDGAAKLIEQCGDEFIKNRAYSHLISRDPAHFWTSGQWMTERQGGSDVADGTDTTAVGPPDEDGSYCLHGYKWFTSATDAEMAFTLARLQDESGMVAKGTSGLSLFYLETRLPDGRFNNLEIQRLKNKLGTRQLPTAELLLDGTKAFMVGGSEGRGVAGISPMLTITRLHNSISAVGAMRRILLLSRDYSTKRMAFRRYIADHPLHTQTLARMEVETRGCVLLTLEVARLLGLHDCGIASLSEKLLLRILLPILKLYTAKQAVAVTSEGLESFGGQGYIEDTGLPTFLRDAQVLPIWEGTTNILSLDLLRVLRKSGTEALNCFVDAVTTNLNDRGTRGLEAVNLSSQAEQVKTQVDTVTSLCLKAIQEEPSVLECAARDLAFSLAQIYISSLLISHTLQVKDASSIANWTITTRRWCYRPLPLQQPEAYSQMENIQDQLLVMDGYELDRRSNDLSKLDNKI